MAWLLPKFRVNGVMERPRGMDAHREGPHLSASREVEVAENPTLRELLVEGGPSGSKS